MESLMQRLALLEERTKSWRKRQLDKETQMKEDYARRLAQLDEEYEAAEREIDLEFDAKLELLRNQYKVKAAIAKSLREERCSESNTVESPDAGNILGNSSCPNAIVSHHNTTMASTGALRTLPREDANLETVLRFNTSTKRTAMFTTSSEVVLYHTDRHSDVAKFVGLDIVVRDGRANECIVKSRIDFAYNEKHEIKTSITCFWFIWGCVYCSIETAIFDPGGLMWRIHSVGFCSA